MTRLAALLSIAALVAAGCSSEGSRASGASAGFSSWDEGGISFEYPNRWNPSVSPGDGGISLLGPDGEELHVLPFFIPVALEPGLASVALERIAPSLIEATWGEPSPATSGVRMSGTRGTADAVAAMAWTPTESASAGFVVAASASDYAAAESDFARVVESLRIAGTTEAGPAPAYQTFTDRTEGAFSAEVPDGWQVDGGVVRPCPTLVQGYVEAASPGLDTYVKLGSDFPWFTEPYPSLGLVEGGTYGHPCGYQSPVRSYLPGERFVLDWLMPNALPNATVIRAESRPDLAAQLTGLGFNSYDAGEVEYSWEQGGQGYRGLIVVITERFTGPTGGGAWSVWRLALAEGTDETWPRALAAGEHLVRTFTIDPQWAQMQAGLTAAQAEIIADMGASVAETVSSGYWGQQATYDAIFEARSDATLETEDFVDPVTGETYELDASPQYYWIDPSGTIVGTDTSAMPNVDFRELIHLPT